MNPHDLLAKAVWHLDSGSTTDELGAAKIIGAGLICALSALALAVEHIAEALRHPQRAGKET